MLGSSAPMLKSIEAKLKNPMIVLESIEVGPKILVPVPEASVPMLDALNWGSSLQRMSLDPQDLGSNPKRL